MRANLYSFQLYLDTKGNLMVEFSSPRNKDIKELFNEDDWPVVNVAINKARRHCEDLPELIEQEVEATYNV